MENWKAIEGTGGMLEISTEGRVRSNLRDGRILKASPDSKGYLRLRPTINKKKMNFKIHREVAKAFIENPEGLPQVNHKDGDKTNNRVYNLEWVSNRQNAYHAMKNGLWGNVLKASAMTNEKRKCPIIATNTLTGEKKTYKSISDAEKDLGTRHITDVLKGKRSQAKGFTFERG